jgi:hypothetical protein
MTPGVLPSGEGGKAEAEPMSPPLRPHLTPSPRILANPSPSPLSTTGPTSTAQFLHHDARRRCCWLVARRPSVACVSESPQPVSMRRPVRCAA